MNLTRWTRCLLAGHSWEKLPYQDHADTGSFVRCRRCEHENHEGTAPRPTGAGNAPLAS